MADNNALLESFLNCHLCSETFRDPVSLSCNHSFCSSCLQKFWEQTNNKNCPICRRKSSKDNPWVNFALKELSDSFARRLKMGSSKTEKGEKEVEVVCRKHDKEPELFCKDEDRAVCPICDFPHRVSHTVVPVDQAVSELKEQLKSDLTSLQDKRNKYKQVEKTCNEVIQHSKKQLLSTETQIRAEFNKLHQFLKEEEESRLKALREEEEQKRETISREMKRIQEQISSLSVSICAVEEELQKHNVAFLSSYKPTQTRARVQCSESDPQLVSGVLIDEAKHLGNLSFRVWEKMKDKVHFSPVILDPNTANSWLYLSDDLTSVRCGDTDQQLPDNPERYTKYAIILGSEGFSSGKHSWEVEVGDHPGWTVGLVKESADRKGEISALPKYGIWCLLHHSGKYTNGLGEIVTVKKSLQRIRVQMDYDRGEVSFYDPEDMTHIFTHRDIFTETLVPYFGIGESDDAQTREVKMCHSEICVTCSERAVEVSHVREMAEKIAFVQTYLNCHICSETFRDPVSLSCNHSFCSSCLQKFWEQTNNKNCPICKRKSSKENIGVNFALKELSDSFAGRLKVGSSETEKGEKEVEVVCRKHDKEPELFCKDEDRAVCPVCDFPHRVGHTVVPVDQAVSELKEQLKSDLTSLQDKRNKYKKVEKTYDEVIQHSKKQLLSTETQIRAEFNKLHQFLKEEEESRLKALREEEEQKGKTISREKKRTQEQISSLSVSICAVEEELQKHNVAFLSSYKPTQTRARVQCSESDPQLVSGVLIDEAKHLGNLSFRVWEKMKDRVHFSPVILDPNTAHSCLYLSDDLTGVRQGDTKQLPGNSERHTMYTTVLGSEGFCSGKHGWEVEVGDHPLWIVGLTKESADRKGEGFVLPKYGVWCLLYGDGKYTNGIDETLTVKKSPQRIRVQLDYDRGEVSFYNPEDMTHIYTYKDTFGETVFPFFSIGESGEAETREVKMCHSEICVTCSGRAVSSD
ncbi:uncharacterized protein LOC141790040 [Halichoeres trimaculatus]|uniref:uncharacterized protein LOC141790040 n=1 Tax=Halichoeres trimaculatus TaxID=147232 RepID=UPI003D9E9B47